MGAHRGHRSSWVYSVDCHVSITSSPSFLVSFVALWFVFCRFDTFSWLLLAPSAIAPCAIGYESELFLGMHQIYSIYGIYNYMKERRKEGKKNYIQVLASKRHANVTFKN